MKLFTIGNKKNYSEAFINAKEDGKELKKVGRGTFISDSGKEEYYEGGIVFETAESARNFLKSKEMQELFPGIRPDEFSIYELKDAYENDYEILDGKTYGNLLKDVVIVGESDSLDI